MIVTGEKKKDPYYDWSFILSEDRPITVVIGARGIGKKWAKMRLAKRIK